VFIEQKGLPVWGEFVIGCVSYAWLMLHTVFIPIRYISHTYTCLIPALYHTILIHSSYTLHTYLILCSYCSHTIGILPSYLTHTSTIHKWYSIRRVCTEKTLQVAYHSYICFTYSIHIPKRCLHLSF